MDKVIVKDVSGGIQKHECADATVKDGFLYIKNTTNHTFAYNIDNLISYSILRVIHDEPKKKEEN